MAITRARLAFLAPWRRGFDAPAAAPIDPREAAADAGVADMVAPDPSATGAVPDATVEQAAARGPAGPLTEPSRPTQALPPPEPADQPMPRPMLVPSTGPALRALIDPAGARRPGRRLPARGPDGRFVRRETVARASVAPAGVAPEGVTPMGVVPAPPNTAGTHAPLATPGDDIRVTAEAPAPQPTAESPAPLPIAAPATTRGPKGVAAPLPAEPEAETDRELSAHRPVRIVLVEDVSEVAIHVRDVLRPLARFKLVHVITDGRRAEAELADLHPDVVMVDSLLQGKVSGRQVVERLRRAGSPIGVVVLSVPDHPADGAMVEQADAVVTLPFGTYELGRGIADAHAALVARDPGAASRIVSVFSAKGGVGKTTVAFSLAAGLASSGLRTLLVDGCLEFGEIRRLLHAGPTAPSICDLPTDRIRASDLDDTVVRAADCLDALLAPPRPELAELITGRDLERLLGVLRHAYPAIVVDTPSSLSGPTLALLDASDAIIDVLTADPGSLELTRLSAATFREIGYPASKVRYLVNRADSAGAAPMSEVSRAIGRDPDYALASDWPLVSVSQAAGIPFVLARPEAAVSAGLRRVVEDVRALAVVPSLAAPVRRARIA
jgi:pilus assembly protein CpaE